MRLNAKPTMYDELTWRQSELTRTAPHTDRGFDKLSRLDYATNINVSKLTEPVTS